MKTYKEIDDKIQRGYDFLSKRQTTKACDEWLGAWESVKTLFSETKAKDIYELDEMHPFTQCIGNYAQDLEAELHNAGLDDPSYHEKRIQYCTELLEYCGKERLTNENTRRAIAEAYSELGDMDTCGRFFEEWLRDDPNWGWGYIGWSDCWYLFKSSPGDPEKAEQILLQGLSQPELRDRIDVVQRLIDINDNDQLQRPDKVHEYKTLLHKLMPTASKTSMYYKPSPIIKQAKPGRNEPCPCGSGKKYKKCCGAKMVV